ncbi:MAG: lysostaphin resistance A-like protein [Lachnospiraceae bacterium]
MKWRRTDKVYWILLGFLLGDILINLILYSLVKMGVKVQIPIALNLFLSELIAILPAVLYLLWQKINPWRLIPHKRLKMSVVFLLIVFTWLLIPLIIVVNAISMLFVDNAVVGAVSQVLEYPWYLGIIMMALVPALVEEFVCRGVIFHSLRFNGIWKAIFISSLCFGIMHMNFNQMSYAIVLGMALALVVEATDSIWASVLVHFVFNATSVLLNYIMQAFSSEEIEVSAALLEEISASEYYASMFMVIMFYAGIALVTTSLAILIFWQIAKLCNRDWCMRLLFEGKTGPYPEKESVISPFFVFVLVAALAVMILLF